jgi:hypothetical protein
MSVAVFASDIDNDGLPPPEEEVSGRRPEHNGQAEPRVERHHDQHQEVRDGQLNRKQNYENFLKR